MCIRLSRVLIVQIRSSFRREDKRKLVFALVAIEWLGQQYGMLLLCILIYIVPPALLVWTLRVVFRRGHFRNLWLLITLNVLVLAGIIAIALTAEQGTFQKVAEVSYYAAFVCAFYWLAPLYYSVAMHYFCPELMKKRSNE